jgi:tRNA G37 N-methylase Trm5
MTVPRSVLLVSAAILLVVAVAAAQSPMPDKQPEVPYVPTADRVLDQMLDVAKITKQDVVFDLGCGDGRIVIAAAKRFGARGVGIDIDPQRIKEANENARAAGVQNQVTFILQDLFEANISTATVVMMYLLPEVNLRLRPKLLAELKPGTRIVSHNYDLGDWKPLRTIEVKQVETTNSDHTVYFWVVPPRK